MIRNAFWSALWLTLLVGCQQTADRPAGADVRKSGENSAEASGENVVAENPIGENSAGPADAQETETQQVRAQDSSASVANSDDARSRTIWQVGYVQGDKISYSETSTRRIQQEGRELVETQSHSQIRMKRFDKTIQLDVETTSLETPEGEVLRFRASTLAGADPAIISGRRDGDAMLIETTIAGRSGSSRMPCPREVLGFHGVEQSLEREPLAPGQKRVLKVLLPLMSQVAIGQVDLTARDIEPTKLLDRTEKLLHVDQSLTLPDEKPVVVGSTLWTDRDGRLMKITLEGLGGLNEVDYRTTREVALADGGTARFDLGFDSIVKVDKPLPAVWQTKRVRYRVELADKNPVDFFPASATQQVTPKGPHVVEILVLAPDLAAPPKGAAGEKPSPQDSAPSGLVQSDDPTIVAMARQARGTAKEPLAVAMSLEKFVHETMHAADFSQAFSSALEVARSKTGDCTEYAVLLAALARASGLPARVAMGLVYVPTKQGFGYHMWTEVFVDGRWLPLDATLGQGGIGASHLKLSDTNLADSGASGQSAFTSLLPVIQVMGSLKISILEAK